MAFKAIPNQYPYIGHQPAFRPSMEGYMSRRRRRKALANLVPSPILSMRIKVRDMTAKLSNLSSLSWKQSSHFLKIHFCKVLRSLRPRHVIVSPMCRLLFFSEGTEPYVRGRWTFTNRDLMLAIVFNVRSHWLKVATLNVLRVATLSFLNTFTPKNDQWQISPATSPEILYHTVWRTWLFIAY